MIVLPQNLRSQVEGYVKKAYEDFTIRNDGGRRVKSIDEYLRSESLSLIKYLSSAFNTPPTLLTSEGDILLFSSCEYTLSSPERAVKLLDACQEPCDVGELNGALRYDWVESSGQQQRRDSDGDANKPLRDGALTLQTYRSDEKGLDTLRVLGNLTLRGNKLELNCASEQRLVSCKALIERVLGKLITQRSEDRYVEPSSAAEVEAGQDSDADEFPPEIEAKIAERFFEDYYEVASYEDTRARERQPT